MIPAIATIVLIAVAAIVGVRLLHHRASEPSSGSTTATSQPAHGAIPGPSQPGSSAASPAPPSVQLTRYITDSSGVLDPAGRTRGGGCPLRLYTQRNVHLWVAYVNDFSGLTPFRWAEDTMRANGFSDTDGLLAIATANKTFSFRPPVAMTNGSSGTRVNAELIRKDRIAPAVRNDEWARAAVGAANGLGTAG